MATKAERLTGRWSKLFTSSGAKTSDAAIATSSAVLGGVFVAGGGSASGNVVIYDNPGGASGTELFKCTPGTNSAQAYVLPQTLADSGLYLDLGTDHTVIVYSKDASMP